MSGLRHTPFYRALHRPNLFMGAEREPIMIIGVLCAAVIISCQDWIATIFGTIIWFTGLGICRLMAKVDPHLVKIYWHHIKYSCYYPSRSKVKPKYCKDVY